MTMKKICSILFLLLTFLTVTAFAEVPPEIGKAASQQFSAMLKKVMPAVVNITVQGQLPPLPYPFQNPKDNAHGKNAGPKFEDVGSGVIIDSKNGYIITNAHVIRDAKLIVVTLSDGQRLRAKKIGADKESDIAVIQVKTHNLTAIPVAKSDSVKVGNFVAAIGNPFGLHQTVTSGVISALHRSVGIEGYEDFIQTDAPINPGNSGGALINLQGELIGMNTAIIAPAEGNVGIGFAIPVSMIQNVAKQLIKNGKVKRGVLGVMVQDLTPNLASAFNMSGSTGVIATQILPNSAASKAGLRPQDVIEYANGVKLTNASQLKSMVGLLPAGTSIKLKVKRGGKTFTTSATIQSLNKEKEQVKDRLHLLSGVSLRNYDMFNSQMGEVKGVQVTHVNDTSDSWLGGVRPGDVILTANGQSAKNIDNLLDIVNQNQRQLLLRVWRQGGTLFLVVT